MKGPPRPIDSHAKIEIVSWFHDTTQDFLISKKVAFGGCFVVKKWKRICNCAYSYSRIRSRYVVGSLLTFKIVNFNYYLLTKVVCVL